MYTYNLHIIYIYTVNIHCKFVPVVSQGGRKAVMGARSPREGSLARLSLPKAAKPLATKVLSARVDFGDTCTN